MTSSRSASTGACPRSSSADAKATSEPRASAAATSVPPDRASSERPSHDLLDGAGEQVRTLSGLGDQDPQQFLLLLELEEDIARDQRELGPQIAERRDGAADLAHRLEARHVPIDAGDKHRLLASEVVKEAARARREPGRALDLGDGRGVVPALAEEAHGLVEQALPGRT